MDPETIDAVTNIDAVTAAVVGAGAVGSLVIGFAKRFGGERFVLIRKVFGAFARLVAAIDKKLS